MAELPKRAASVLQDARSHYEPTPGAKARILAGLLTAVSTGAAAAGTAQAAGNAASGAGTGSVAPPAASGLGSVAPPAAGLGSVAPPAAGAVGWGVKLALPLLVAASATGVLGYQAVTARDPEPIASVIRPSVIPKSLPAPAPSSLRPSDGRRPAGAAPGAAPQIEEPRAHSDSHDAQDSRDHSAHNSKRAALEGVRSRPRTTTELKGGIENAPAEASQGPAPASDEGFADGQVGGRRPSAGLPEGRGAGSTTLRQELALIREASRALQHGRPQRALSVLEQHESSHPRAALWLERRALRVLALCALGRADQAQRERGQFLKMAGGSPMAVHVRAACKEGQ